MNSPFQNLAKYNDFFFCTLNRNNRKIDAFLQKYFQALS